MKLIMLPVIVSLGAVMFAQRDKMADLYHAAYPVDPAKAEALRGCAQNRNFNRLDSGDRAACYEKAFGNREAAPLVPTPQPVYEYSPSHLPGNDIRRQEANTNYLNGGPPAPAVAEVRPTAPHPLVHPIVPHHAYQPHHDLHPHLGTATPTTTTQ